MSKPTVAILADFPAFLADASLPKPQGHYAVWLAALFSALENQDEFEIHWIVLSKDVSAPRYVEAKNQHIHILPRARKTIGLYTLYLLDRWRVARILEQIRPDLLHAWGSEDCYAYCGRFFEGKKLLSIQGILTSYMQRGAMSSFHRRHSRYELPSIRAYRHVTTESPWAADRINELVPGRILHHLEYAVEDVFFATPRRMSARPCVLFAGSDTPIKNLPVLLKAFQDPRLSGITLKLAGISPDHHPGLPANIQALGRVSRQGMTSLLAETWCLVHPSLADTGPTIVKEARVMGVPVVLSSECGSKQHVREGKSGFVLEPHDTEGFIQSLLQVCASRETAEQMGVCDQEACRKALCSTTMRAELLELYRELLSETS